MTLQEQILELLKNGSALDDDQITAHLDVMRQAVNRTCRTLAGQGIIVREYGAQDKIVNRIRITGAVRIPTPRSPRPPLSKSGLLKQDEIKTAMKVHLERKGYAVALKRGPDGGVDIDAQGPDGHLILEAMGEVVPQSLQVTSFLVALGELLQSMSNPRATYGLALPYNRKYRALVARLPSYVCDRLGLVVYFVARANDGKYGVTEVSSRRN